MTIYGIAAMCIFFLTFAMQPDVIDYSEYKKNASVAGLGFGSVREANFPDASQSNLPLMH